MKKYVWLVFCLGWVSYGGYRVIEYFNNLPPASDIAQKIIDSMDSGVGWRYTKNGESGISHDKANITIDKGWIVASVKHGSGGKAFRLSYSDRFWINKAYTNALLHLEEEKDT